MADEITVASTTDVEKVVEAAAQDKPEEARAAVAESSMSDFRESGDGAVLSYESPQSERIALLQRLAEAERDAVQLAVDAGARGEDPILLGLGELADPEGAAHGRHLVEVSVGEGRAVLGLHLDRHRRDRSRQLRRRDRPGTFFDVGPVGLTGGLVSRAGGGSTITSEGGVIRLTITKTITPTNVARP